MRPFLKTAAIAVSTIALTVTAYAATDASSSQQVKTSSATTAKAPANGMVTAKNPNYTLKLSSNATTGYSWFVLSYPHNLVQVVSHKYIAPNTQMAGAPGTSVWQFKVKKAALAVPTIIQIKMLYARPWEVHSEAGAQNFYIVTS
jgi:inhibitor of cysteine peptidase